ncbi:MAG: DUF2815 family protein [Clostridia bacterium]
MSEQTHVVTGPARLSYAHLTTPYKSPTDQGDPKYSVTLLVPKTDTATKARIDAAVETAKLEGKDKWNGVVPPMVAIPIYDGDGVRPSDGQRFGDECKGCWVFTASAKHPPKVVDGALQAILDDTQIYSGMYANVAVDFWAYNSNGRKGIGCGLGNVQKVRDGEPLGGSRRSPEQDFQPIVHATPQPSYAPQPQPSYAQQLPGYAPQQAAPQPDYAQQSHPSYAQQMPGYAPPQAVPQVDPITGLSAGGYYAG